MNEHDELMLQITSALETAPDVDVPADFTARMMARIPQQRLRRVRVPALHATDYGRSVVRVVLLLLLVAMVAVAPRITNSVTWSLLQLMLFAQFCALLLWIGVTRRRVF